MENLEYTMVVYESALKIVSTKIDILNESYKKLHTYNPIEHIKSRIKSESSIIQKLQRKKLPLTIKSIQDTIEDIAGIRIICAFSTDIYEFAKIIKNQSDIKVISESDYITNPKPSGYRSYHLIIQVPVFLQDKTEYVKVEIQIRTAAMDFWASLEHKAKYKYDANLPKHLIEEFKVCADKIDELDKRMFLLHDIIQLINN